MDLKNQKKLVSLIWPSGNISKARPGWKESDLLAAVI
jgi:hypothetical protein